MSFAEREMRFTFSGSPAGSFSAAGLRAAASIAAFEGRLGCQAQVKIWGLSMDQMNAYSSRISAGVGIDDFNLTIEVGDLGSNLSQVINGAIWRSFIDLSDAPDSAFNVTVAGIYDAAKPIPSQSHAGPQNAEELIYSLCQLGGFTFANNGAHCVLRNHATYGSVIDQIDKIATAANFNWYLNGDTVTNWPNNGTIDGIVIDVGPATEPQMVGYPRFWEAGIIVTSLFNQQVQVGRQMNVTSNLKNAAGLWQIIRVQHELTTMMDKGPWFTTAVLAPAIS
jgi:hypothetical protein